MYNCRMLTLANGCKAWIIECLASKPAHWFAVVPVNSPYAACLPAIVRAAHKASCNAVAQVKTA